MKPKMSKSRTYCSVSGCNSRGTTDRVSFHSFPKDNLCNVDITNENGIIERVDVRKAWEKILRFTKKISESMKVCSKHFQESDYHSKREDIRQAELCMRPRITNMRRKRLKMIAVPSRNLPTGTHEKKKRRRKKTRNSNKIDALQTNLESDAESNMENKLDDQERIQMFSELLAAEALCDLAEV